MSRNKQFSIIIVSYKRIPELKRCLRSVIINLSNKDDTEIIVVDNASLDECKETCRQFDVAYHVARENLGVCGGRNLGISIAKGEYLLFVDDDSEVITPGYDTLIRQAFNNRIGVLAFRVISSVVGTQIKGELPFRFRHRTQVETSRLVSYFVGAGFAVSRRVLTDVGNFPEEYFYGVEELDLSYRVLMNNWQIYYMSNVIVVHHMSPIRITNKTQYYHKLKNRFILSAKYLPFPYCLTFMVYWILFLMSSSFQNHAIREWKQGLLEGFKLFTRHRKTSRRINKKVIEYLKRHEGRLWF
jgi:GT2 family glycosyltransferase